MIDLSRQKASGVSRALRALALPSRAVSMARYFKTGRGEYGAGDRFLGITTPQQQKVAKTFRGLALPELARLLRSPWHEERSVALAILVDQYGAATNDTTRGRIFRFYMKHVRWINNWDLVDSSAAPIVGAWLAQRPRSLLTRLALSPHLWSRRIAIIATHYLIRSGEATETLRIATLLRDDQHDLIHKAVGWMLRELGKRVDAHALRKYLRLHADRMPRTMLRYAIERFPPTERARWLKIKRSR